MCLIRIVFFLIIFGFRAYAFDAQQAQNHWKNWTACILDEECVPIHDACGGWTAVNRNFQQQGEDYQGELAVDDKCVNVKLEAEPKVLCIEHVCTVKPAIGFN